MPSPDIRPFIDLTLYDRESQDIYLETLDYMRVAFPEFQPMEGTMESVILQAIALEVAELVRSINRLPGGVLQALLQLFDVARQNGTPPSAMVRINGSSLTSVTVPAGTRLFYQATTDSTPLVLTTDSSLTLTHAKVSASFSLTSNVATFTFSEPHGFSTGQSVTIAGSFPGGYTGLVGAQTLTAVTTYTVSLAFTASNLGATAGTYTFTPAPTFPVSGFVTATGTAITSEFNGISAGTSLDLLSVVPQIATASLATSVDGGAETETDAEYFQRASAVLSRVNSSLVTADNFTQWVLEEDRFPVVFRGITLDTTNAARGEETGSIAIVVAPLDATSSNLISGDGTGTYTVEDPEWGVKDEIRERAMAIAHAALSVSVVDPMLVTVKVNVSIHPATGVTGSEATLAVTDALAADLSPNVWPWKDILRKNEVVANVSSILLSSGARAVDYVTDVTLEVTGAHIPPTGTDTQQSGTQTSTTVAFGSANTNVVLSGRTNYVHIYNTVTDEEAIATLDGTSTSTSFVLDDISGAYSNGAVVVTPIAYIDDATGDLTIVDPAPLVLSDTHEVTVV